MTSSRTPRTVVWHRQQQAGLEYCTLCPYENSWLLDGEVIIVHEDRPLHVRYRIGCSMAWETRAVLISLRSGSSEETLQLTVDTQHRWWNAGTELPDIRGCQDVDLSISPSTNTLPIRRLNLGLNTGQDVTAAWIRFPDLIIEPLAQRYTRLTDNLYRYESGGGQFMREIEIDEAGLVTDYPGIWQRITTLDDPVRSELTSPPEF
jgi:hypothetical protein